MVRARRLPAWSAVKVMPEPSVVPAWHLYDTSRSLVAPSGTLDDLAAAACRANSFVPGTVVLMADGTSKPIEDVEIGDYVWATDPETGEAGPRASGSSQRFNWQVGNDLTTAHQARIDGKPFVVQFFREGPRASELATAFVPNQRQLSQMYVALGFG